MQRCPRFLWLLCGVGLTACSAAGSPTPAASSRPATPAPSGVVASGAPSGGMATTPAQPQSPPADAALPALQPAVIYSGRAPDLSMYDPSRLRLLVATGDVVPARVTNFKVVQSGGFTAALDAVRPVLRSGDITLENLGDPLISGCPATTTGLSFCGDPRWAAALIGAGTNVVVNVANNHIGNHGQAAVDATVALLGQNGAQVSGFDHIAVRTIRGVRFAFVGFDFVVQRPSPDEIKATIAAARAQGDIVVAQLHDTKQYETYPLPDPGIAPADPRAMGRLAIDDGADIVIGNFPHCPQPNELYGGHLITYGHGNFLFDQDWSIGTQESIVGKYWFFDTKLVAVQLVPMRVVGQTTPTPLDPTQGEGRGILDRLLRSARELIGLSPPTITNANVDSQACT